MQNFLIKVYLLKSLSIHFFGKMFFKVDNPEFSTSNMPSGKLEDAEKAGFLILDVKLSKKATEDYKKSDKYKSILEQEKLEAERIEAERIEAEKLEAEKLADILPEDFPCLEELAKNKITTFTQLNKVDELKDLEGIGIASAKKIIDFLTKE